jgi:hypothetical protein
MRFVPRIRRRLAYDPVDGPFRALHSFTTSRPAPLAKEVERRLELAAGVDGFDVHESPLTRITNFAGRRIELLTDDGFQVEPLRLCE